MPNLITFCSRVHLTTMASPYFNDALYTILPYVKEHGGDALCLFTNSQINRKFYQKNGFREFNERFFTYMGKELGNWSYVYDL